MKTRRQLQWRQEKSRGKDERIALPERQTFAALSAKEVNTLPILNIDFAIENKTKTQQTNYLVTGVCCSSLDLKTAGEKAS